MTRLHFRTGLRAAVVAILVACAAASARAEESLAAARDLYASAAYDEALKILDGLVARAPSTQERESIDLYRILCLFGLSKKAEAERGIEQLVARAPLYRPPAEEVSPRVRSTFSDVRRRLLPAIIQRQYQQSKAAFDREEFAAAADGFKQVLEALADPDLGAAASQPPLSDLHTLAGGFHELSVKAAEPPVLPAPALTMTLPQSIPSKRIYSPEDRDVIAPSVIRQEMPTFRGRISVRGTGIVEVVIDESGAVELAVMRASLGPQYDAFAVGAARTWRYRPATVGGVPVKFRKAVQINLAPGQ